MLNMMPSMNLLRDRLPQMIQSRMGSVGQGMGSMMGGLGGMMGQGGGQGDMNMPSPTFGGFGGGPQIDTGPMMGSGRMNPSQFGVGNVSRKLGSQRPPQQTKRGFMDNMQSRMSTSRPGFWGKYNTIAQGLQPFAMDMLNDRNQGY